MSMIGNFLRVTEEELKQYLEDSSLLEDRIYNDEDDNEEKNLLDIDKAWDGIIFLLTGEGIANATHPLVSILFSGQLIDEEQDLGYGPAHYLIPDQVVDINNQIKSISEEELKKKYNPAKMTKTDVYPSIWEDDDEAFDYLYSNFQDVQEFFGKAAENHEAVITFIS